MGRKVCANLKVLGLPAHQYTATVIVQPSTMYTLYDVFLSKEVLHGAADDIITYLQSQNPLKIGFLVLEEEFSSKTCTCLLYTSDAADE